VLGKRERDVRNRFALPNHLFTQHGGTRVPGAPIDQLAPKQRDAFIGRSVSRSATSSLAPLA
jgi:hypothetical protein